METVAPELPFRDVLILTQYYAPEPGAPQIRLRSMARELQRLGVNVRVITGMPNYPVGKVHPEYRGRLTCSEKLDDVPVRRVWLYPAAGRGSVKRLVNYLSFSFAAFPALLGTRRPDLVFVEAQPVTLALTAWLASRLRGIPYVYNTPDLQIEVADEAGWIGAALLIRAARRLESFLMRRALAVSTVTHAFMEYFIEHRRVPRDRMTFLPNGADTEQLQPLPRDVPYAESLGVRGKTVFTYAGTHAHYQGLEVILEAAKLLRHRDDIVILMVGQGPMRAALEQEARSSGLTNVLFRESPFAEMPRLMSLTHASLVVLRDIPAATRMRLSKAVPPLACGVPVIYAGKGETAEIIAREACGLAVEPEQPQKLAAAIERLADDQAARDEMGRRGRTLVERDLAWRTLVQDWARQIARVAEGKSPGIPSLAECRQHPA